MLNLASKKVVVAGGGKIATRRLSSLIETGAQIQVVSLTFTNTIVKWAEEGKLEVRKKAIEKEDIEDAFFIIAATDSLEINQRIAEWSHPHQLINVVDKKESGNIVIPAHLKRGDLSITVSTNGASPVLTKLIKNELAEKYDHSFAEFVSFLKQCREIIHGSALEEESKLRLLKECAQPSYLEKPDLRLQFLQRIRELRG
ncbi:NAD(P)-dependent oxidoreductase [Bacillus songklensis]|uniref:precorrin-2 dehydrogenase n=2 Tax=Bacillus songklensis TaxID=1069116 RepID=A0ABV8BBA8_9BACI